jgi:hypothetical protein
MKASRVSAVARVLGASAAGGVLFLGAGIATGQMDPGGGRPRCLSTSEVASRVLERRLGRVDIEKASVSEAVDSLREKHHVPLLFLEGESRSSVTVTASDATTEQVLSSIVAQTKAYQFGLVNDHVVLYSREPRYSLRLEDLEVTDEARLAAAYRLGRRLQALNEFSGILLPEASGTAGIGSRVPLYSDRVTLKGGSTVIEQLANLAGTNPSVVTSISRKEPWGLMLSLGVVPQLKSLKVSGPKLVLQATESVQLSVVGQDIEGAERDLTGGACGTVYGVQNPEILGVTSDGLVEAKRPGKSLVRAECGGLMEAVTITVSGPAREGRR